MGRQRDYVGVSYGGPRSKGRSAARLARYAGDREGTKTFGDKEAFLEEAKERALEGHRASYVHVVIAPERADGFEDRDFERLIEPFLKDRDGNECAYFGAIYRDTDHAHVHLAVARDKFLKTELERLKEHARGLITSRERLREEPWHDKVREREERAAVQEQREREGPREREGSPGREHADHGHELER